MGKGIIELVAAAYRKKLENGINREQACAFNFTDFPELVPEDFEPLFHEGYAKRYKRSFALTKDAMEEFENN